LLLAGVSGSVVGEDEDVFWDVAPCSLVEVYWRFRSAYCLRRQGDDSDNNNHLKAGKVTSDCMAQHPRRQSTSQYYFICFGLHS